MLCQCSLCCRLIMLSQIYITINKHQWIKHCVLDLVLLLKDEASVLIERNTIILFPSFENRIDEAWHAPLYTANEPFDCSWPLWWSDQGLWTVPLSCLNPEVITLQRLSCLNFGADFCSFKTHFHGSASLLPISLVCVQECVVMHEGLHLHV